MKTRQQLVDRLNELIDRYWDLAYAEGQEGRTHDTASCDAQRTRDEISRAISNLAGAEATTEITTGAEL
jgi:hypothetical protein